MPHSLAFFVSLMLIFLLAACPRATDSTSCRTIDGDIEVNATISGDTLTDICVITGELNIDGSSLTSLVLPQLTSVGGSININRNAALSTVSIPSLGSIGGGLFITENRVLKSISMPLLTSIKNGGFVTFNPALSNCSGALLAKMGDCSRGAKSP